MAEDAAMHGSLPGFRLGRIGAVGRGPQKYSSPKFHEAAVMSPPSGDSA